ncbi:MAG: hypothetical protein MUO62_14750 [Anaerolineales bacterium]|nr:hypothetical protein [Anaerolineales bacterium]
MTCLNCHLFADPLPGEDYARFTGCASYHSPALIPLSGEGFSEGEIHVLTTAIPYNQCNTCHNRGNYDLRTMIFMERTDHPTKRIEDYYQPIAQFTQWDSPWIFLCKPQRINGVGPDESYS